MIKIIGLIILLFIQIFSYGQCPKYGSATHKKEQDLNRQKNKSSRVPRFAAGKLPLRQIITSTKEDDDDKYWPGSYIFTEGYLVAFEEQGPESSNCKESTKTDKNGDVHMFIGLVPNAVKRNCMIVEVTPSFKQLHPNYDFSTMKKQKVRVYGYLMYDFEHTGNSVNYCKSCRLVWRKTCWEIHPVTKIELL